MKKSRNKSSQNPPKEKKYFNPYDDYGVGDYTYRRQGTEPVSIAKKRTASETAKSKRKQSDLSRIQGQRKNSTKVQSIAEERQGNKVKKKVPSAKGQPASATRKNKMPAREGVPTRPTLARKKKLTKRQRLRLKRMRQVRAVMRIVLAMGVTIAAVWGVFILKDYLTKTAISTQIVQVGSLDTSTSLEGVVLRSEKVVYAKESGAAQYVVAEGEKVKKDGTVYVLIDQQQVSSTTSQIEEVEKQIYNKAENSAGTASNQDEKYNLAQEVKNNFVEYYNNCAESSTSYVYALRSKLDSNVSSRTNMYVSQQQKKDDELVAQKLQLDEALSSYQTGKAAEASGIISFHMDGYESEDVAAALSEMTYDQFNKLKKVSTTTQLGQSTLEKESPIYKLILNNTWYVVTYVDEKEDTYVQGSTYKLNFDGVNDQVISFNLIEKQETDGKVRLTFKTSDQINQFLSNRGVSFSIGDKSVSGLKIPTSAIVEQNLIAVPMAYTVTDNQTIGVYRQKGEVTEFVPLDIQSSEQEEQLYYVLQDLTSANTIKINDTIVSQDDGSTYQLKQSIVKQGVYVVNGKVASFKEIEMIDQSTEYAIVRYNNNSQLKEMDKIISNPKSVKNDQLIDQMKIQNE